MELIRRRPRWRRLLAECEADRSDLLLLLYHDFLRDPSQGFIVAVAKLRLRHFDGVLMVLDHGRNEIQGDIARRLYRPVGHHPVHCRMVFGKECGLRRLCPAGSGAGQKQRQRPKRAARAC
jgi:hypothetical protein